MEAPRPNNSADDTPPPPSPPPAPSSSSGPAWGFTIDCPLCSYMHMIAVDAEPTLGDWYVYVCPVTQRETRFPAAPHRARSDIAPRGGSIPGTRTSPPPPA